MSATKVVDFMTILAASFYSTFRMIAIAGCGGIFVKTKIIDKKIMKGVAEIGANLLIPSLIIAEILRSFKISDYETWLPILVYCLICVGVGFITGFLISKLFCLQDEIYRLILVCCMFSNSTSMQLVYVDCLSSTFSKFLPISQDQAKSSGNLVVLLYTIFVNFLRWSIGYYIMQPTQQITEHSYIKKLDTSSDNKIKDTDQARDAMQVEFAESNNHRKIQVIDHNSSQIRNPKHDSTLSKICKQMINIPLMCGLVSIILTMIPFINSFVSDKDGVFNKTFVDSFNALGQCSSTFIIFLLGLNIAFSLIDDQPNGETVSLKVLIIVLIAKLLVLPLFGYYAVYYVGYLNKWIKDPILAFFLITNFFTPTAVNMITISVVNKFQINNMSKILVYSYILGCITMTGWTVFFLELLL